MAGQGVGRIIFFRDDLMYNRENVYKKGVLENWKTWYGLRLLLLLLLLYILFFIWGFMYYMKWREENGIDQQNKYIVGSF